MIRSTKVQIFLDSISVVVVHFVKCCISFLSLGEFEERSRKKVTLSVCISRPVLNMLTRLSWRLFLHGSVTRIDKNSVQNKNLYPLKLGG